jgi:hypothetical protein
MGGGSECIVPRILNLGTRWWSVLTFKYVSFTPWPLYPLERSRRCPIYMRLVGAESSSGRCRENGAEPFFRSCQLCIFPTFYGNRRFITVFTRALHRFLSWARWIPSAPSHPISLRSILLLPTHLRLGLPSGHFPSGFPTNSLYVFMLLALPISSSLTCVIVIILCEEYNLWSSSFCSFLHSPVTTPLSSTPSLYVPPLMLTPGQSLTQMLLVRWPHTVLSNGFQANLIGSSTHPPG